MDTSRSSGDLQFHWSRPEQDYDFDLDAISKCNCQTGTLTGYLFRVTANLVVTTRNPHILEVR